MTAELLDRTRQRVCHVIAEAGLSWGQVHEVLAVGGSSRMPMVIRMLRDVTGKEPNCSLPPGEAVAHGAAIHAAIKALDLWTAQSKRCQVPFSGAPAASDAFSAIEGSADVALPGDSGSADDWEDQSDIS